MRYCDCLGIEKNALYMCYRCEFWVWYVFGVIFQCCCFKSRTATTHCKRIQLECSLSGTAAKPSISSSVSSFSFNFCCFHFLEQCNPLTEDWKFYFAFDFLQPLQQWNKGSRKRAHYTELQDGSHPSYTLLVGLYCLLILYPYPSDLAVCGLIFFRLNWDCS